MTNSGAAPRGVTEPIPRELFRLALPIFASLALRVGYQWVDALWVQGLGVAATAAVTTSVFVMWTIFALNDIFGVGVTAYVSQLLGAGQRQRAGLAAYKGLRASALVGLGASVVGLLFAKQIYGLMGASPEVSVQGAAYLRVILAAAPLPIVAATCEGVFRASGNARLPFFIDLGAVALNALLDPPLIYGWGPIPRLGVVGAAWATVFSQALMVTVYLVLAARRHPAFPLARSAPGPRIRILRMSRVGLPAATIGALFSAAYVAFAHAAAKHGSASLAVVGVVNRIETLEMFFGGALGIAGAALVGQNLGAGERGRAKRVVLLANQWMCAVSLVISAVMVAFPHFFIGLFSHDPEVHRIGATYLRILAPCLVFTGAEIVTAESVMGSGHTAVISWMFGVVSVLRILVAPYVGDWTGTGVLGIAWLISVTCILRASAIVAWALRGTWLTGLKKDLHGTESVDLVDFTPKC